MSKSSQESAILKTTGPCLVMAGAGTGKTYTIVQKVAHLVKENIYTPDEILCLTFSNEATNNLKEKILNEIKTGSLAVKTFHGFCADVLKEFGHLIKIKNDFKILTPDEAKLWMHKYLEATPYNSDRYVSSISTIKDLSLTFEQIEKHAEKLKEKLGSIKNPDEHAEKLRLELNTLHLQEEGSKEDKKEAKERKKEIKEFLSDYENYAKYRDFLETWKKYEALKKEKGYLDYADLNSKALLLLRTFDLKDLSDRYKYIFVDEFQDTNKLQFDVINHIAGAHRNITVVGDMNQAVYGFRGAYKEIFNHFKEAFKIDEKKDIFKLDKSRRSPNKVLRVAHSLITNNYEDPKDSFLVKHFEDKEGKDVQVIELKNGSEEARKIAEIVEEEIENKTPLSEICVLYRTHAQGKMIRQALESKDIPVIASGKTDLMQTPEIKTIIAYLSMLSNLIERTGTGEQSWWNLFHYHNALTPQDSVKIGRYLKADKTNQMSVDMAALEHIEHLDISEGAKTIVKRIISKLKEILNVSNKALPDLILDIFDIVGLNRAFTHERTIRNVEALMNLKQFHEIAVNYYENYEKTISSFIEYIELLDKLETDISASKIENPNAVNIMTMHAVKGLEFKTVIVTNLAEKRFPIERTPKEPLIPKALNPDIKRHLESLGKLSEDEENKAIKDYEKASLVCEERRLCYVAFTRAKEKLIVTRAKSYNGEENSASESLFLREINFKENKDITVSEDKEEKCTIFAPCSRFEQFKSLLKSQFVSALDSDDFNALLSRLVAYHAVREGEIIDYSKIVDWKKVIDKKELETHIKHKCGKSGLEFDKKNFTFSPTALITFDECPKKYELSQIFRMPERGAFGWSAASTGSFVHQVFENGVKANFTSKAQFIAEAKKIAEEDKWHGVNLAEVGPMIEVFWARNNGKYSDKSLTEEWVNFEIEGLKFNGKIDRIDPLKGKDVEITDYKSGKLPDPKERSWQLGFYAIGVKRKMDLNAVKLTLDMLKLEKPFEATLESDGNYTAGRSTGFNLKDVEKEIVDCAKKVVESYEGEFLPVKDDGPCKFCGFKFYCPKWEEK